MARVRQVLLLVLSVTQAIIGAPPFVALYGNMQVGEMSDKYFTAFTPAGYTFSIWGVIYSWVFAFAIYQALPAQRDNTLLAKIGWPMVFVTFWNTLWVPIFVNEWILASVAVILMILTGLTYVFVQVVRHGFTPVQRWLVKVPLTIFFGWVTVATVANISVLLVALNFDGFGIPWNVWSAAILVVATSIVCGVLWWSRGDITYAATLSWAFVGVAVGQETPVAMTAFVMIGVLWGVVVWLHSRGTRPTLSQAPSAA